MPSNKQTIKDIQAYECLDSRGFPTLSVRVTLISELSGTAMVPSGASTGEFEAHELRDGDSKRYLGRGVLKAVENVNTTIHQALTGADVSEQASIDQKLIELDGTENKSKLGANAILGVSLAAAHAAANAASTPLFAHLAQLSRFKLPIPLVNVINGGAHAANSLDFQEFMLVPHASSTFSENLRAATEVFQQLKKLLKAAGHFTGLGDEGGFAPNLAAPEEALDLLMLAIQGAGYRPGADISIALDVAASEFYDDNSKLYIFKKSSKKSYSAGDLVSLYESWLSKYPLVSIEDGLDENDWDGWCHMTKKLGARVQLVGDDLFVTNTRRLADGIKKGAGNAVLVKPNQIGTLSETIDTVRMAHENNYATILSHRSGETEDTTIADLSVALGSGQIKTGSVCRSERTAKYNRLLWIEGFLASRAYVENPFA